jgi:hypothetical protein
MAGLNLVLLLITIGCPQRLKPIVEVISSERIGAEEVLKKRLLPRSAVSSSPNKGILQVSACQQDIQFD